jgi:uncharacterized protein involved in exopolysaccharide biosynthesis
MTESFDAFDFASHLDRNWKSILVTCGLACVVTLGVSLLLPKKYTATARILIEPPAGSDSRAAQAVSPIYLESLRTYERFASSDSLFLSALHQFKLREEDPETSVEQWKRRVLKVEIPRNTRILEIHATLRDARKARELAHYLAQQTVALNRSANRSGDEELIADTGRQLDAARTRLRRAEEEKRRIASLEPTEDLAAQIRAMQDLRGEVLRDLLGTEALIAEDTARVARNTGDASGRSAAEMDNIRRELPLASARAEILRKKRAEIGSEIAILQKRLAERLAKRESIVAEWKNAQANVEALDARVRETRASAGFRGERLSIVDPGIVPERPSSPNIPLNVVLALALGAMLSGLHLTLAFSRRKQGTRRSMADLRLARQGHDG